MNASRASLLILLAIGLPATACGLNDNQTANPAPISTSSEASHDAGADQHAPEASTIPSEAGEAGQPVVRTVIQRSPLGHLNPANLLLDGDFEMSGMDSMQYVWFGEEQRHVQVGAACRSGVRCLRLAGNQYVAGSFMWPASQWVRVGFYAKPAPDDACKDSAAGALVVLDGYGGMQLPVPSVGEDREDGWCHFERVIAVPKDIGYHLWALMLAARPGVSQRVTFDDASIESSGPPSFGTKRQKVLDQATKKLIEQGINDLHARIPGAPRPHVEPIRDTTGRRQFYRLKHGR